MSEQRCIFWQIIRGYGIGLLLLVPVMFLFAIPALEAVVLVPWRLLTGFIHFLSGHAKAMQFSATGLASGLIAFGLALVLAHLLLRGWLTGHRRWPFTNTLCLGLLVPLLYAVSFIIPGVLLQLKLIPQAPLLKRDHSHRAMTVMRCRDWSMAMRAVAKQQDGRFPESLLAAVENGMLGTSALRIPREDGSGPGDAFIYMGAGLTLQSDPRHPLVISPPYLKDGRSHVAVTTIDSTTDEIPEDALDQWLDQHHSPEMPPSGVE